MGKTIIGIGEVLWDIFPNKEVLGGAPANFAYNASQLGNESYIVSAIGYDQLGDRTISALTEKNLKHSIDKVAFPTGTVDVELDDQGAPYYIIHENVAWDNISFTEEMKLLAQRADTVCFGSLAQRSSVSRDSIKRFLQFVPDKCLKVFDINLRQHFYSKEIIEESLTLANALKLNEDEIVVMAEFFDFTSEDEKSICKEILERYNLELVILTKGADCSYVFTQDSISYLPTPKVIVADTVGAGDAFTATFVVAYLNGVELADAHRLAVDVSAFVCTQLGGMNPLPDTYKKIFN